MTAMVADPKDISLHDDVHGTSMDSILIEVYIYTHTVDWKIVARYNLEIFAC